VSPVRRLLPLLVPVALLAATGCSKASGPTQEQYASAADGVCKDSAKRIDELYAELWEATAAGESSTYVDRPERWMRSKVVPEYERMSSRLKGIQPPDGDLAYVADLYSDLDARIEVLHNRPGDGRDVVDGDKLLRDRFEAYGIEWCPPPPVEEPEDGGQ
jgi:hypothetical protein